MKIVSSRVPGRRQLTALAAGLTVCAALGLAAPAALAQGSATPVGLWKSVDEESGQAKSLIRIVERDGVLSGRIEKILTDKPDAKCDKCTDERKDQPVLGMTIITGMKRVGEQWEGGRILDPANGKVYSSLMKLIDAGRRLEVRGYLGVSLFGRSQVWLREE